ncbi:MAG: ATP-binding protein [Pseudomonadota bacterium]
MSHKAPKETDLETTRRELGRARDELARASDDLERFVYITSHDLKEPLRGIAINAGFLAREALPPEAEDRVGQIVNLCERMDRMISDLYELSRIGRPDLARVALDPTTLIAAARHELAALLEDRGAVVQVDAALPQVLGDARLLKQMFRHLVENAVVYNDTSPPNVTISYLAQVEVAGQRLDDVFTVRDNGIGIAARYHDRIFHIFTRLHRNGEYGSGTGAGLALVEKIIAAHGGTVTVESMGEGEGGTTFYLTLPLAAHATDDA